MENRFEKFTTLITNISRSIQKIKSFEMQELGLKGKQVSCLYHLLNSKGGLSSSQLCMLCGEDKAAISRTIKDLESLGFVFLDESGLKKYRNPIKLTVKGEEVGKKIEKKIEENFSQGSSGIADDEREKFYVTLTLICENLQKICENKGEKND